MIVSTGDKWLYRTGPVGRIDGPWQYIHDYIDADSDSNEFPPLCYKEGLVFSSRRVER